MPAGEDSPMMDLATPSSIEGWYSPKDHFKGWRWREKPAGPGPPNRLIGQCQPGGEDQDRQDAKDKDGTPGPGRVDCSGE